MAVVVAIVKVLVCVVTSLSFDRLRAPALTIADVEQTTMASESIVTSSLQTDYIFYKSRINISSRLQNKTRDLRP